MNSIYDNPMTYRINLHLPDALFKLVKEHADGLGISQATVIRWMIIEWGCVPMEDLLLPMEDLTKKDDEQKQKYQQTDCRL